MKKDLYSVLIPPLSFGCAIIMTILAGLEIHNRKNVEYKLDVKEKEVAIYCTAAVNAIILLKVQTKLNDANGDTDKMLYLCDRFSEYQNQRLCNAKTESTNNIKFNP